MRLYWFRLANKMFAITMNDQKLGVKGRSQAVVELLRIGELKL